MRNYKIRKDSQCNCSCLYYGVCLSAQCQSHGLVHQCLRSHLLTGTGLGLLHGVNHNVLLRSPGARFSISSGTVSNIRMKIQDKRSTIPLYKNISEESFLQLHEMNPRRAASLVRLVWSLMCCWGMIQQQMQDILLDLKSSSFNIL